MGRELESKRHHYEQLQIRDMATPSAILVCVSLSHTLRWIIVIHTLEVKKWNLGEVKSLAQSLPGAGI